MKNILAVIPARAGSKRLPGKNMKLLNGNPMIYYTIKSAKDLGIFKKICVATDSENIAKFCEENGIDAPVLLPKSLTADDVSSMDACIYVLEYLEKQGENYEALFCLQPTSPLRDAEDIIKVKELLYNSPDIEHVITTTLVDPHEFHWVLEKKGDYLEPFFGDKFLEERIYLPEIYRPNGAVKAAFTKVIKIQRSFMNSKKVKGILMPPERSIHVGNIFDFKLAEFLLKENNNKRTET